mgnify:CR=1 FL=1
MNSCGGLKAVVVSDTINGVILLIGGIFRSNLRVACSWKGTFR